MKNCLIIGGGFAGCAMAHQLQLQGGWNVTIVEAGSELGAVTSSLLGFDGGILKTKSKNMCLVSSNVGEYGPVEDVHLAICHYLSLSI